MTTHELITVHLGEGATPEEESTLSRELAANSAACGEFVTAARLEGALQALVSETEAAARVSACLEAAGVPSDTRPPTAAPVKRSGLRYLAGAALAVAAAGFAWHQIRSTAAAKRSPALTRRPPSLAIPGSLPTTSPATAPQARPAVAEHAGRFFLTDVDFDNEPLDAVIEHVLAAVAADNHLQRAELLGFELAWQPLDVASASSPPAITLHQSSLPLATALEWIAILSDCTVQWHDRGARLVEHLPEPTEVSPVARTIALAEIPGDRIALPPAASPQDASPEAPSSVYLGSLLAALGISPELSRSVRLDPAAGTLSVELPEAHWGRLQKILALREQAAAPSLALTAQLFEFAEPRETTTEVMDAASHRRFTGELVATAGVASLKAPSIQSTSGKPFQLERAEPLPGTTAGSPPDWAGLRLTGEARLAGEVVGVTATVQIRLPVGDGSRSGVQAIGQGPIDPGSLREYVTELEVFLPSGYALVFAVTEKGAEHCLALHLTAEMISAAPPATPPDAAPSQPQSQPPVSESPPVSSPNPTSSEPSSPEIRAAASDGPADR